MVKQVLCAANWKMNKNPKETKEFFENFLPLISKEQESSFLFFIPHVNLTTTACLLKNTNIRFGAQNCYFKTKGAFTGELSAQVLKEIGATSCLVGHSERRTLFSETDEDVALKIKTLLELKLEPVICVGETLEERKKQKTLDIIKAQVTKALLPSQNSKIIIAYEPLWAIGTGQSAHNSQIEEVFKLLKTLCPPSTSLLYGGSVKPETAKTIFSIDSVDGFLVGTASLKARTFFSIYSNSL